MRRIRAKIQVHPALIGMAVLLALSLIATIVLAAFSANRGGAVVLSFADGLTMKLTPVGTSGRIQITAANENETTFSYQPMNNLTGRVVLDGINAEINQDAYIAYTIAIKEITSGEVVPAGAWEPSGRYAKFYPAADAPLRNWRVDFFAGTSTFSPRSVNDNTIKSASSSIMDHTNIIKLFDYIVMEGYPNSASEYVTDLQERSFKFYITIAARTDQAPEI